MDPIPAETGFVPLREWIRLATGAVAAGFVVPAGVIVLFLFSDPAPRNPQLPPPEPTTLADVAAVWGSLSVLQLTITVVVFVVFGAALVGTRLLNERDRTPGAEL